jgi:uncharacterized membrane protein
MAATGSALFILTFLAALGAGVVGGVFLAFSDFVMKSLGRIAPEAGVAAMLSVMLAAFAFAQWQWPSSVPLLAGALLYVLGTFVVTLVCNVPRNNALARDGGKVWADYLVTWTRWNHVRSAASIAAAVLFTLAL